MASTKANALPSRPRPRALADVQFNNFLSDHPTSSEDEDAEGQDIPADDARSVLGVSISNAQTRLTSPKTPAAEKAAAIAQAGGFFGDRFNAPAEHLVEEGEYDGEEEQQLDSAVETTPEVRPSRLSTSSSPKESVRLPSPWRAGPKKFQRLDKPRREGFFNRGRASSGPESTLDSWQKALANSLPSLPKHFSISSPWSSLHASITDASSSDPKIRSKRSTGMFSGTCSSFGGDNKESSMRHQGSPASLSRQNSLLQQTQVHDREKRAGVGPLQNRPSLQPIPSRQSDLRRSASDSSLITQRTLSRVSSLGDDSRFDNVQEQVNSRMKAIRDSWQDSNIKLPSMPTMPNFNLSNFRPDFGGHSRSASVGKPDVKIASDRNQSARPSEHVTSQQPPDSMTRQTYQSTKAIVANVADAKSKHPHFKKALSKLEGDVVVLGGYRGSILRSAEPPHRQLWVPIKVGLNIRKVDLEVGIEPGSDERAEDTVIPGSMLTHIGPVDISRRLFRRLRTCENGRSGRLRVHDYGYDWRLDPNYLSRRLIAYIEKLPCNAPGVDPEKRGATVIAHSLGGLITRHAINQRPELFRGVVYAGVPDTCVNILGPLRNGEDVLLSSRVLTAQVNFTIRTSFVLLPLDGRCFFDKETKEEYIVDFFDPNTWIDLRLSPCVARPLAPLSGPQPTSGLTGFVSSMTNSLPSMPNLPIPGRKGSVFRAKNPADTANVKTAGGIEVQSNMKSSAQETVANGNIDNSQEDPTGQLEGPSIPQSPTYLRLPPPSVSTTVTIPRHEAIAYLARMLPSVKKFKEELAFRSEHASANRYPPCALIYGKSTPTVYGARVAGREAIKHADAYDELAFASGDGVVLARAAMVPEGYSVVKGGVVSSERGHVTLLGDLDAVGRCLNAIVSARRKGVGSGPSR